MARVHSLDIAFASLSIEDPKEIPLHVDKPYMDKYS